MPIDFGEEFELALGQGHDLSIEGTYDYAVVELDRGVERGVDLDYLLGVGEGEKHDQL